MKLTKDMIADYIIAKEVFGQIDAKLHDRITEVVRLVFDFFGAQFDTWYFPNAAEGEVGTTRTDFTDDDDYLELIWEGGGTAKLDDYFSGDGLPVRFLFMENDAILKFIQEDMAAEEDRKRKRNEAAKKRKIEKEQAKQAAMSKLTKAERKVLGIK